MNRTLRNSCKTKDVQNKNLAWVTTWLEVAVMTARDRGQEIDSVDIETPPKTTSNAWTKESESIMSVLEYSVLCISYQIQWISGLSQVLSPQSIKATILCWNISSKGLKSYIRFPCYFESTSTCPYYYARQQCILWAWFLRRFKIWSYFFPINKLGCIYQTAYQLRPIQNQ